MDSYRIVITPNAENDIVELKNYISNVLAASETARRYIRYLRNEINKLSNMPGRFKTVDDEPWHSLGIRRITAKNFFVYYRIESSEKTVYILNVIYAKRDQLKALKENEQQLLKE